MLSRFLEQFTQDRVHSLSSFRQVGFHGDKYLLSVVRSIMEENVGLFIETGANVGSTLTYMAREYPLVRCFSCEPDPQSFRQVQQNVRDLSNVQVFEETSQQFLTRIRKEYSHLFEQDVLFWLDAHGCGFEWPLKEEIAFITRCFQRAYVLIDDFKVPGLTCFGYDVYQDQECSFEYIEDVLNPGIEYSLYYPNYVERISQHHPLRGWGLIEFGHSAQLSFPEELQTKIMPQPMASDDD